MAQKQWIARVCQGLLSGFKLLLRGAGALCSTIGSLLLTAMSHYHADEEASKNSEAMPDGLSMMEREEVARVEDWKSW